MNKLYIVGLIMIAGAIAIFTNMSKDISSYSTFESASKANTEVKVVGTLDKSKEMQYNPELNPNEFVFHMKDSEGISKKVNLSKPRPMEFENAEQIVLTGQMEGDVFVASEMLTKCPSKYKNEEIYIKT
jgi:cytochrome c-type biogenesis protein CcmE